MREEFNGETHNLRDFKAQVKLQSIVNEKVGVLSLSKRVISSLMWSHYGESHEGYAIGFDESHDFFKPPPTYRSEIPLGILKEVDYVTERPLIEDGNINDGGISSLFKKSTDWAYEEEIRMISPLRLCKSINEKLFVRQFPKEIIKEIVFGIKCKQETQERIKRALSDCDIKYRLAVPSSVNYDMLVTDL